MNEIIGIIPHKFRRRGFGVACTLLLRAGLNFLGLAVLLPVLALALDARSLDGGGQLARIYTALGFTSPRSFALTVCAAVVAVIVLKCLTNLWLARIERNYIYDLYRTLSRRLYVTYHDRGLPFVKSSNSAVLARNVNVVCLAFTAGVRIKMFVISPFESLGMVAALEIEFGYYGQCVSVVDILFKHSYGREIDGRGKRIGEFRFAAE